MTNTTSDFGRELDSLADVITFGVAPSLLGVCVGLSFSAGLDRPAVAAAPGPGRRHSSVSCFLIGGASRLARFNISHDPQPRNPGRPDRKYFVGMPIPGAAGLAGRNGAFLLWNSDPGLVGCPDLADPGRVGRIPDGEHVAILVGQGDQS